MVRTHPMMILRFVKRYTFILLIPVARSLINFALYGTTGEFVLWELVSTCAIILLGVVRWIRYTLKTENEYVTVNTGLIFCVHSVVPLKSISGIYAERSLYSAIFGAVRVRIATEACGRKKSDFEFYLSASEANRLFFSVYGNEKVGYTSRSSLGQIILLSASSASALSGMLVAATVFNDAGKLFGDALHKGVIDTVSFFSAIAGRVVPPAAAIIAAALTAGFAISFLIMMLKHSTLIVRFDRFKLSITQGSIWHKRSCISRNSIRAYIFEQSPLMWIFRRCTLSVQAAGYGKRNESAAIIPVCKTKEMNQTAKIVGFGSLPELKLYQPKRVISRIVIVPAVVIVSLLAIILIATFFLPRYAHMIILISTFLAIIASYWLIMRLSCHYTGGISFDGKIRIRGYRRLTICDMCFERKYAEYVEVSNGPLDRRKHVNTVRTVINNCSAYSVCVKNLDRVKTIAEVSDSFGINIFD